MFKILIIVVSMKNINGSVVIGAGFIAKNFFNTFRKENILIFASGVSNSKTNNKKNFIREFKKLKKIRKKYSNKKIIYFSTCSISDKSRNKNAYQLHKKKVEKFIKKNFIRYLIFRLPEVIGKNKNKYTLTNFIYNRIISKKNIYTSNTVFRNILDIDDIKKVVIYYIKKKINKKTIIIANLKMYSGLYIVKTFEKILNKKAKIILDNKLKNKTFNLNVSGLKNIYKVLNIKINNKYLPNKIRKYYK
tara:strand:+ start:371 stop:1111 length:741 start_codon:yes stop_codon:yes gene_type:complete